MVQRKRAPLDPSFELPLELPARALWAAIGLALGLLLISDLRAPLGALDSIPYVIAVLLSLALPRGYETILVATFCTVITLISALFARHDPASREPSILNTVLPIFIVWVTAWLARRYRRAGLDVRAADERIQLAAYAAGLGTYEYDVASHINDWSPEAKRIVGLEPDEVVSMDRLQQLLHPDDRNRVIAAMQASLDPAGNGEFEDEHRLVRPGGSILWVLVKGRTIFRGHGRQRRAVRATGVIVDVTDRRITEQALRESEERLRLATEAAGIGTFDIDLVARKARYSPQLCAIAGLPAGTETTIEELVELVHPEDRDRAVELFRAAVAQREEGPVSSELRIVRPDGAVRWLSWEGRLYIAETPEGRRPVRALGAVSDITEKKSAEEALAEREELYRTLTEAMPHIVYTTTPDGVTDYVNSRWVEYSGSSPEPDRPLEWLASVHPEDRARTAAAWTRSLATGKPFSVEFRLRRADGEYRWHVSRGLPVRSEGRGIARWIGTCTDVHDSIAAAAALKEADRRKDEFLATLAHELRNPLSPMRIAVGLLGRRMPEDAELARLRDVIERQVDQLTRLVDDLLDVSRITRDRLTLRREPVDLALVIHDAIETIRPDIERHQHQLTVTMPDEPMVVDCDAVRITQVFSNLLNNAAKYTPVGGSIWITAVRDQGTAIVRIRDTGVGIPAEKLPRLFEMFYQADTSLDRPDSGLGIGLTLVHRLLEMHGGSVEASSAGPGQGSEFTVRLPVVDAQGSRAPVPAAPPEPAFSPVPLEILVVDDNRDSAEMLRTLLEASGHSVTTAADGDEALVIADRLRPDAILLDIGLPRLNGYEVCRRLRAQPWGRRLLIIAQTGWGQEQDLRKSEEAGFDAHLTKPVDDDALLKLLADRRPTDQPRA